MVFSNTTDKNGLIQRCEDYTNIGDGGISGDSTTLKKFTAHINETIYKIVVEIIKAQDGFDWDDSNYSTLPIGTAALVAGQRDYNLPTSLNFLTVKRIDVTYDGTNWYQAKPIDSGQMKFGLGNAANEDSNFEYTEPYYDPKANGFWLYPRATQAQVDAGASFRIEFTREFDEFGSGDSTQEPAIDRPFHDLISVGASLNYAIAKDAQKASSLKVLWDEGLASLRTYYGKKVVDEQLYFDANIPSYK